MAKVLLCDEDLLFLRAMKDYLTLYGLEVNLIGQPRQVVPTLLQDSYGLFICSRWMPTLDGVRLSESIRASHDLKLQQLRILLFAPEDVDMRERQYLRRLKVSMILKYHPVSRWVSQINTLLGTVG